MFYVVRNSKSEVRITAALIIRNYAKEMLTAQYNTRVVMKHNTLLAPSEIKHDTELENSLIGEYLGDKLHAVCLFERRQLVGN